MENLELQLKQQIIEALNLEEITAEEIATDAPLFGEGLGLDSIDALEITLLLEKHPAGQPGRSQTDIPLGRHAGRLYP